MHKELMLIVSFYIFLVNLIGLGMMFYDKRRARQNNWRVREKTIFTWALWGAAWGIYSGMKLFRHKTQHDKFIWGIPALGVLNIACYVLVFWGINKV